MKLKINTPIASKINWTALAIALTNVVAALGYIPEEHLMSILAIVNTAGPLLIMVFRTKFTEPKPQVGP